VRSQEQSKLLCLKQIREQRKLQQINESSLESRRERSFSYRTRNPSEQKPLREMLNQVDNSFDVQAKFKYQITKIEELETQLQLHSAPNILLNSKLTECKTDTESAGLALKKHYSANNGWLNSQHEAILGRIDENPRESLI